MLFLHVPDMLNCVGTTQRDEAAARRAVDAELYRRGWDVADLVRAVRDEGRIIDAGTVGDFLRGVRWPRRSTLGTIEHALGMSAGYLEVLASGEGDPTLTEQTPSVDPHRVGPEEDSAYVTERGDTKAAGESDERVLDAIIGMRRDVEQWREATERRFDAIERRLDERP